MKITDVAAAKIHLLCLNSAFDRESIGVKKWLVDMDLGKVFPNIGKTISTGESSFKLPGIPIRKQVKGSHTSF